MRNTYQAETTTKQEQPQNNNLKKATTSGNPFLIVLSLFSLYLIWGGTYLGMRTGLEGFPRFLMACARFLTAGSLLYVVSPLPGRAAPTRAHWLGSPVTGRLSRV